MTSTTPETRKHAEKQKMQRLARQKFEYDNHAGPRIPSIVTADELQEIVSQSLWGALLFLSSALLGSALFENTMPKFRSLFFSRLSREC